MNAPAKVSRRRATKQPAMSPPEAERLESTNLGTVVRAVVRGQTRALAFERLAVVAADLLRGTDTRPPQLLLKLPGGGAFQADVDDVMELEADLLQMASSERVQIGNLMASAVQVRARDLAREREPRVSNAAAPEGETLEIFS